MGKRTTPKRNPEKRKKKITELQRELILCGLYQDSLAKHIIEEMEKTKAEESSTE